MRALWLLLLPSLALRKKEAEEFLESLQEEIQQMTSTSPIAQHT